MALASVFAIGALHSTAWADEGPTSESPKTAKSGIDFKRHIQPIFAAHCYECHGAKKHESEYRLDVRKMAFAGGDFGDPAIIAGNSAESPLFQYVAGLDEDIQMPPEDEGEKLSAVQIELIRKWIDGGADWPDSLAGDETSALTTDHWSFQPLRRPQVPLVTGDGWSTGAIDTFILRRLRKAGLKPSPQADRVTLIRRLYLVMLGLPPTPKEVHYFVEDRRSDAYRRLVERVLASPHYGERWARHWLDVVRFGESNGFETNRPRPNAYHYRDYVIDALNSDKPYDQFVVEQIAGDAMGEDAATGFLVAGAYDVVKSPDINLTLMQRQNELADIVNTTGMTFMGLTLGCARCHSHKFDPIPQKDYYAIQAVFAGVQYADRPIRSASVSGPDRADEARLREEIALLSEQLRKSGYLPPNAVTNTESFAAVQAKFIRFTILATNVSQPCVDELEVYEVSSGDAEPRNVALASVGAKAIASSSLPGIPIHKLKHINDGRYGNSFSWISNEPGRGWVQIELATLTRIDRIVWGRDREGQFSDRVATKYVIEVSPDATEWQTVASNEGVSASDSSEDQIPAKLAKLSQLRTQYKAVVGRNKPLMAWAGRFSQPGKTHRLYRGDPMAPREVIAPSALSVLNAPTMKVDEPEQRRRIEFANWLVDKDNPLTARVMANRLWHYHFGTGIVSTPSDLGKNGTRPSHPELLDYLAVELVENGWSLKHLHRMILLSSTYQQSSRPNVEGLRVDASVRFLWRYPPRRLEAEPIRDSILSVAGSLVLHAGGPGFLLFNVDNENVVHYHAKETYGPAEWRRMIYMTKIRQEQDSVFGVLDCPDGGQSIDNRSRSTTPLQALNLLNSPFMMQQAEMFARRLRREAGGAADAQIQRAFHLLYGRSPEAAERDASRSLIAEHGLLAMCRALLNTNEFLFVP